MTTIFASSDSNIVLSNGGLTATKRSTGNTADSTIITADNAIITADLVEAGYGDALSQTTRGATKVYAEVHLDNQAVANEVFVGICTPAGETVGFLGQSLKLIWLAQ